MNKTIRNTRQVVIDQMLKHCPIVRPSMRILEPSAGSGDLADGILRKWDFLSVDNIDCVELNNDLRNALKSKGYTVMGSDFLKFNPAFTYDLIVAAPTYKNNVDVEHIMHMYDNCLSSSGGRLVSLTYPAWTMKNGDNQKKFRKWLEDKEYYMVMLKDNSFVENYETQPSMIIVITKTQYEQR